MKATILISFFKVLLLKLSSSIKRYPEAILTGLLSTVLFIIFTHLKEGPESAAGVFLQRIALVVMLGFPLTLIMRSLLERQQGKGIIRTLLYYSLLTGFLLFYFFFLLKTLQIPPIMRYVAITIAFYLLCPVIPYFYKREPFERFVIFILARLSVTFIYAHVIYLGMIAMLFTINSLFSAGISNKLYLDLYLIAIGVFSPSFFLADIPRPGEDLSKTDYPKVLKIMLLYILLPIIAAYLLILYAYFAKILYTREWPSGMVANLVLWYAFITLVVIFLIFPMRKSENIVKWSVIILTKALLPMILMMFASVWIRIRDYGITEDRYFVLVAGAGIFAYLVYLSFSGNPRNILLLISFSVVAILSVTGPWSAFSVSVRSQNARFEKLLLTNGLLKNGVIVQNTREIPEEDRREISSILYYFKEMHTFSDLRYLPKNFNVFRTEKVFGFRLTEDRNRDYAAYIYFYHILRPPEIYSLEGYDYFSDITLEKTADYHAIKGEISVDYSTKTRIIRVFKGDKEIYKGNPDAFAVKIANTNTGIREVNAAGMTKEDQAENVKVRYLFKKIQGSVSKRTGKARFEALQFYFFIKMNSTP
jgi:hypothetical protein